jgi:hypothetical protein
MSPTKVLRLLALDVTLADRIRGEDSGDGQHSVGPRWGAWQWLVYRGRVEKDCGDGHLTPYGPRCDAGAEGSVYRELRDS